MLNTFSLLLFSAMLAGGQLLFKKSGQLIQGKTLEQAAAALLLAPAFYSALFLYGAATLLWIWILSRVPLTEAYPWVGVGVILVPALAYLLYGERVGGLYWVGSALIAAGIIVTQLGASKG